MCPEWFHCSLVFLLQEGGRGEKKYGALSELEILRLFFVCLFFVFEWKEWFSLCFSATPACADEGRQYAAVLPFQRAGVSDVGLHRKRDTAEGHREACSNSKQHREDKKLLPILYKEEDTAILVSECMRLERM